VDISVFAVQVTNGTQVGSGPGINIRNYSIMITPVILMPQRPTNLNAFTIILTSERNYIFADNCILTLLRAKDHFYPQRLIMDKTTQKVEELAHKVTDSAQRGSQHSHLAAANLLGVDGRVALVTGRFLFLMYPHATAPG